MATGAQDMGRAGPPMLSGHGHGHSLISFLLFIVFFWMDFDSRGGGGGGGKFGQICNHNDQC